MVNEEKVRIMSKLAWYEKEECKEELKDSRYYKNDYIRLHLLKSILSMTLGVILIAGMLIVYNMEYLVMHAVTLDYRNLAYTAAGIYFILLLVYGVGSFFFYSARYKRNIKKLREYYTQLKELQKLYEEEI